MATNDFLPFATGGAANVLTQAQWAALGALLNGFQSGIADSKSINKAFRQSSIMATVLAQFISDQTGANSVDDGTTATLLANLKNATAGRILNVQVFTSSGTYTPTPGTKSIIVEGVGGGGGGGGAGAAGSGLVSVAGPGAGACYARARFTSGFSGAAVVIGARGSGGPAGANAGGVGGTTSFGGAMLSIPGGGGGVQGNPGVPIYITQEGIAPTALPSTTGTMLNSRAGIWGSAGFAMATNGARSGHGGESVFGSGALGVTGGGGSSCAEATYGYGGGGSGGVSLAGGTAYPGGAGAQGLLIIMEFA